ncbi:nucleotidyltransferase domain-containing protein [Candidatus Woesearchaeota archaeon]|nr:nucleotidyltransferase domain-containing protein [Candidatus Woesearchaeota archaeon]
MSQKKDKGNILFFRESTFAVAERIFNYPNKTFHVRMLAEETKLSTTAVVRSVEELEQFRIITTEETPLTKNIKADLNSDAYAFYKIIFNLYRIKRYGFVDELVSFYAPEVIVLFGSFAKGEDIEESDVDLLILNAHQSAGVIPENVKNYEKEFARSINLHFLPSLEKSSNEFKNALANGVVLYGYLKVI